MDEQNLWDFKEDNFPLLSPTDHSDRGEFSSLFEVEEKVEKHTVITNVGAKSLEINAPISMGMTDHDLRNAINQCNKAYWNNEID